MDGPMMFTTNFRQPWFLHIQCVMLPMVVKHDRHLHNLSLHLPLDEKDKYFEFFCDLCEEERNPDDCVYYCEPCELAGHIGCGISGFDRPTQDIICKHPAYKLSQLEAAAEKEKLDKIESLKYQFGSKEEADNIEETDLPPVDVLYCPKEHPLVLVKYTRTIQEVCAGCSLHISGLTYSCEECNWFIHKRCNELPKEINHSMHSDQFHSLKLISHKSFTCDLCSSFICDSVRPAFGYECVKCPVFYLDTSCALLPNNLNHPSHEHALTPVRVSRSSFDEAYKSKLPERYGTMPLCYACGLLCEHVALECESCNFYIHVHCSLFPLTGKHTRHRHTLNLTYSYKEDPMALEFYCDTCEKPRIPGRWVYSCPDPNCVIVSHIDCVDPDIWNTRGTLDLIDGSATAKPGIIGGGYQIS